jgi:hypothetical protein
MDSFTKNLVGFRTLVHLPFIQRHYIIVQVDYVKPILKLVYKLGGCSSFAGYPSLWRPDLPINGKYTVISNGHAYNLQALANSKLFDELNLTYLAQT